MPLILNKKSAQFIYFSVLISIFPISFIAGNMIININLILLVLSALILFQKKIFQVQYHYLDKLLILFFFLVLFSGFFNDYKFYSENVILFSYKSTFSSIIKSLLFLKYLILYFVLRFLTEKDLFSFKFFFMSCALSSIFVSLDIILQLLFGKDIFGYEIVGRHLSGPFGDEKIAGGYLQRFSLFIFFLFPLFYKINSKRIFNFLIIVLFFLIFFTIILSGNRMPLILFFLMIVLISVFQKGVRKYILPMITFFILVFSIVYNFNGKVRNNFKNLYKQINNITTIVTTSEDKNIREAQYLKEFETFYDTWLMNKYFGGGIKNFRYYCHNRPNIEKGSKFICNMHPHNYYLEILTETGIFGLIVISLTFLNILYLTLYKKYFIKSNLNENLIIVPFLFLFLIEIFPIKSTGSFFTTGNATYLFLIMGILIGLMRRDISIEKKY